MTRRLLRPLVALLLGALVAEVGLRWALSRRDIQNRLLVVSNEGARMAVLLAHEHATRWMMPEGVGPIIHDADLGWRNRPGTHLLPYGTVDEQGARAGLPPVSPEARRVVILGDSFAYGYGVADHETLGATLQAQTGAAVFTHATPGWSHEQMLRAWARDGQAWEADLVVLVLVLPDVSRNGIPATDYLKPWASLEGIQLKWNGLPVPSPDTLRPPPSRLLALGAVLIDAVLPRGPNSDERHALTQALLERLSRSIRRHTRLVVLSAPTPQEPEFGRSTTSDAPTAPGQPLHTAACAPAHACVDATEAVYDAITRGNTSGVADGHWDAKVNRAIAMALAPEVQRVLNEVSDPHDHLE